MRSRPTLPPPQNLKRASTSEAVDGRKEIKTSVIVPIFSTRLSMALLGRPDKPQTRGQFQNYKGKKCKWFVSILLSIFHHKFALKPEIREYFG